MMAARQKKIHVACGQIVCRPGDIAGNLRQVRQLTIAAAEAGARFVLFAEGALTGYVFTPEFLEAHALAVDSAPVRSLQALSRKLRIVIAVGAVEQAGEARHVSHFILFPNGRRLTQRKHNLTPTEKGAGIVPGPEERKLFTVGGVRFGICICADSGIPDIRNKLAAKGCEVYCGPCAGGGGREQMRRPEELDDADKRKQYLDAMEKVCFGGKTILDCRDRRMAVVAVNLAGDDGIDHYHPGHSMIFDSRGRVVALRPGEYVADYLMPELIHGTITVQAPCQVAEP
jgi:predicted amidohydrolase